MVCQWVYMDGMDRPTLNDLNLLEEVKVALGALDSQDRIDKTVDNVKVVAYWVGDIARVDVKVVRK